jgi:hypothetical protein
MLYFLAGPTRLRGLCCSINWNCWYCYNKWISKSTTVSSSTNTQVYIPVRVGAQQTETLNIPEDGVLYAARNGTGIVDGIGITGNTAGLIVVLFIDK